MMLVSLISYVDRNTLALLAPVILKDTGLSNQQYGYIISAFSFAYMIGNPVWGLLLDRIGLRNGMTAAVALWTAASTCHAFASGLFSFGIARAILGFGEGATFPGGLRTAVQTLSLESRSKGIAISYSGGSLGAIVTPWIVTPVAIWLGWRGAFWCTGIIGALWILAWRVISRRPEIRDFTAPAASATVAKLQWSDPRIWAFMAIYGIAGSPLAFILYNSSLYFVQGMHRTQVEMGQVLWIPPLGWEIGYFFWGWVTDALPRGDRYLPALRRQMMLLTLLMIPLAAIPHWDSFAGALALMFFTMFIGGGFIISAMSYVTRVFASDRAGLIAGLGAGSWSLVVALLAPGFGRLFDQRDYSTAFAVSAVVPVIGYAAFHLLSQTVRTPTEKS
jgi:ACS family hexuronate transporter-like MFS transporter